MVTAVSLLPGVQARVKAAGVLADAVDLPFPRPFADSVSRSDATLDGVTGHLYVPGSSAPPIVLLPGAAPLGKDDPRAVRLATSLTRAGRVVFVPDLTLAEQRFDFQDLERIVRAVLALGEHAAARGPAVLLGISYGGSYALVAAADPRLEGRLAQVAVFGAYFDLVSVIQAVTTGVTLIEGSRIPWDGHPMARAVLQEQAVTLAPQASRPDLRAALDGRADPQELKSGSRAIYELLVNRDPTRTPALAAAMAPAGRSVLTRFSPASVADNIRVPVIAMHSTDDPAVPFAELLRMARGIPDVRLVTVGSFRHVDLKVSEPGGWLPAAGDLWAAWRFTSWLIEAQE